jgi:hypothetical protein
VVAEDLPDGGDQQVAHGVVVQWTVAVEAVLQDGGPLPAPLVVGTERGQGHPQITGREHAELVTQTAGRAAVVGHCDDAGEVGLQQSQGRQAGRQPVSAAQ